MSTAFCLENWCLNVLAQSHIKLARPNMSLLGLNSICWAYKPHQWAFRWRVKQFILYCGPRSVAIMRQKMWIWLLGIWLFNADIFSNPIFWEMEQANIHYNVLMEVISQYFEHLYLSTPNKFYFWMINTHIHIKLRWEMYEKCFFMVHI